MKRLCVLGSGSKGNCTFIESGSTRILIDAGLSAKQIEVRLRSMGVNPETIEAICITHDHVDHYQGARVFCDRWGSRLYANPGTKRGIIHSDGSFGRMQWKTFRVNEAFMIGSIKVRSFRVSHDASDPVGFVLTLGGTRIGICTDLGTVNESVNEALNQCEVIVLESNHDPRMLAASKRPAANKKRIAGKKGHLCNQASAEFAVRLAKAGKLKRLYLAHLSEECNRESIAHETVVREFRRNRVSGVEVCMTHQGKKALVWNSEKTGKSKATGISVKKGKNGNSQRKTPVSSETRCGTGFSGDRKCRERVFSETGKRKREREWPSAEIPFPAFQRDRTTGRARMFRKGSGSGTDVERKQGSGNGRNGCGTGKLRGGLLKGALAQFDCRVEVREPKE